MKLTSVSERTLLAAWAVIAALAIGARLGGYPLIDADEGRNGEVGREMAATNDYVMPHLDALPYLDKPIVYFAAEAGAVELFGPTEFAVRLPAWIFTILTALVIAWFAARQGVGPAAAAIIFLSMPLTIVFARTVIFDSALSLFITVAMVAFYMACDLERSEGPGGVGGTFNEHSGAALPSRRLADARGDKRWAAVAWAAIGLGVITKGPVAIAVPLIIAIPYAVWRRRLRALWSIRGLVLFVMAVAPWVWAISRAVPDFLRYVLVTETAKRLTTGALKRTGPPWYFIPYLIAGAFPWCIALIRRWRSVDWLDRYLMLWIAVPFIFFSLSQSKRPQYILPLMPAIALLVARAWERPGAPRRAGAPAATLAMAVFGAALVVAAPFVKLQPEVAAAVRSTALIIGVAALVCGIAAWLRPNVALIALSIPMLLIPVAANPLMNAIALQRSTKQFVARFPPGEVIGIRAFTGSMAFYLRRPIILVSPDGEELTSNYILQHYSEYAADPVGTLKPMSWLARAFGRGRVLIVRNNDRAIRAMVEQHGGRAVASSGPFVAYTMPR